MAAAKRVAESRAYFKALGVYIMQLRKEQGLTQAELARALGVSQQTVFAYELGDRRVTVPMVPKLARILGVSVEQLMGITKALAKTQQRFVIRIIDLFHSQMAANSS